MRKLLVSVIVILSGFWLTACGRSIAEVVSPSHNPEAECGFVQNVYGERISWKGQTPIRIALHESVPTEFYPAIESAFKDWETATGRPLFQIVTYGLKGPLNPRQDGVNVVYWLNTWETGRETEQARTMVYWVGDQIREADIRINAKNFSYYIDKAKTSRDVHLESLLVHELGHVLGLKHKDSSGSVMATYLASQTNRANIPKTDVESIRCEY